LFHATSCPYRLLRVLGVSQAVLFHAAGAVSMKLIGMLDSPYVRRVAISLQLLGLKFDHQSVSVFRGMELFKKINPVIKAPTLVCDDGRVLMDSSLILQYAESRVHPRTLLPADPAEFARDLQLTGLALAAVEKSVQIVYEHQVRPPEKLHQPWLERITHQMLTAYTLLEQELAREPLPVRRAAIRQSGITIAVVWEFTQHMQPQGVPAKQFPHLAAFSAQAEALPEFKRAPFGEGEVQHIM
jgi:glutathione S-transferase